MGGTISVASELGKGTTFSVTIPFKIVDASSVESSPTREEAEEEKRLRIQFQIQSKYLSSISNEDLSRKAPPQQAQTTISAPEDQTQTDHAPILVAEDNPINRKVICKLINSLGFQVDSVSDGLELIGKFNEKQHKIVITDMVSTTLSLVILTLCRTCPI